jgi:hypothetical protein
VPRRRAMQSVRFIPEAYLLATPLLAILPVSFPHEKPNQSDGCESSSARRFENGAPEFQLSRVVRFASRKPSNFAGMTNQCNERMRDPDCLERWGWQCGPETEGSKAVDSSERHGELDQWPILFS